MTVNVWSVTEKSRTRFYVGRKPGKGACHVGKFEKLYDPYTGRTSEFYTYTPTHWAQQPSQEWLYWRMPR